MTMDPFEIQKLKDEVEATFYDRMVELMLKESNFESLTKPNQMKIVSLVIKNKNKGKTTTEMDLESLESQCSKINV